MQNNVLFIERLDCSVTYDDLEKLFKNYGEIRLILIIAPKGLGVIEMSNPEEAEKAKMALNGSELKGKRLEIDYMLNV